MKRRGTIGGTMLAAMAALAALGAKADDVTWIIHDSPPQYVFDGPRRLEGYKDRQLRFLIPYLPGFRHNIIRGSVDRLWYEIAHRPNVCALGMLPNRLRRENAVLGERPVLVPGFRLAVAASRADRFAAYIDADGEIDLDRLAGATDLKGSTLAGRVHAKAIEDFIARPDRAPQLEQIVSPKQIYSLVQAGRLDFMFGGPHEVRYFQRLLGAGGALTTIPIKGVPRLVETYISCSKGETGRAVVDAANAVLRDDAIWAEFMAPLKEWMDPADFTAALAVRPRT